MGVTQFLKNQLGLIFTFLVILSVILIVLNLSIHKKHDYFVNFKIMDVTSVRIKSPKGLFIIRKGTSDKESDWMVEHNGVSLKMDERTALTYLASLARIEVVEKFLVSEFQPTQMKQIFEDNAKGEISVTLKTGKPFTVTIGETTPSGTELYALTTKTPKGVYTISNRYENLLFPTLIELQQRQMIDTSLLTEVVLKYNGTEITLIRDNGKWVARNRPMDAQVTEELIKAVKGVFFENYFSDVPEPELVQYGLLVPDLAVLAKKSSGSPEEYILSHYGTNYYMASATGEKRDVYILNGRSAAALDGLLQKITK